MTHCAVPNAASLATSLGLVAGPIRVQDMPLLKVMRDWDHAFDPDQVTVMVTAFEETLNRLGLVRREDAMTLKVAKLIVEFARRGEDNRDRLVEATVAAVRNPTEDLAGERAEHGSNAEHHHNQKRNFR